MAEASSDNFIIPTVDIAPFLANPDSKEADDVVHRIRNASRTSGFFQITGHGVSRHLQDAVFQSAKHFFALPLEEKKRYAASPGRGYERIGEQNLEPGTKPDLKEASEDELHIMCQSRMVDMSRHTGLLHRAK